MLSECRISQALGHSRGRWYQGITRSAQKMGAANLWASIGLLVLELPSRGILWQARVGLPKGARSVPGCQKVFWCE